jgi:hypothetical protein
VGEQTGDRRTLRVQVAGGREDERLSVQIQGPPRQGLDGDPLALDRGGGELLVRTQVQGLGAADPVPGRRVRVRIDPLGAQQRADARLVVRVEQERGPPLVRPMR